MTMKNEIHSIGARNNPRNNPKERCSLPFDFDGVIGKKAITTANARAVAANLFDPLQTLRKQFGRGG